MSYPRYQRKSAAGSQATFGDYPHVCAGCGKTVRISGQDGPLWFETTSGGRLTWHFACRPRSAGDGAAVLR